MRRTLTVANICHSIIQEQNENVSWWARARTFVLNVNEEASVTRVFHQMAPRVIRDVVLSTNLVAFPSLEKKTRVRRKLFLTKLLSMNSFVCVIFPLHSSLSEKLFTHTRDEAERPSKNLFQDHINYRISSLFCLLVLTFSGFCFCRRPNILFRFYFY